MHVPTHIEATGVEKDLRTGMYEYDPFEFDVITEDDGDVKSQLLTRVFENFESIKIIQQAIETYPTVNNKQELGNARHAHNQKLY